MTAEGRVMSSAYMQCNHLAMAVTRDPGDEVLIEHPACEPLANSAEYPGAEIRRDGLERVGLALDELRGT